MTFPTPITGLDRCEAEQVHLAASIQPHGVLLALEEPALRITQVTATCLRLLRVAATDLLEHDIAAVLDPALAYAVRMALDRYTELPDVPASFLWRSSASTIDFVRTESANNAVASGLGVERDFTGYVHRSDGLVVLELEPAVVPDPSRAPIDAFEWAAQTSRRMRACVNAASKAQSAAESFRFFTGYDRVMVYRFHEDSHGEVIAEACRADMDPYLGHHYPASDIPAQVRALLLVCPTRDIVDVDYALSPLLPAVNPVTGRPLDLSRSVLRSPSPVHLQYLRNMRVGASLTASLVCKDRLWGLIACHHDERYPVSRETREIAQLLAVELALQITLADDRLASEYVAALKSHRDHVLATTRGGTRLSALLGGTGLGDVLGAVGADGVALIRGEVISTGGVTPEPNRILEIVSGLSLQAGHLFATECLSEHLPETVDIVATAAGVAAVSLPARAFTLVWFRGEQARSVTWAGDPDKAESIRPDGLISPRKSFQAWTQGVRLRSRSWRAEELESARELQAAIDLELRSIADEALARERQRYLTLMSISRDGIHLCDMQGRLVEANDAFLSMIGRGREDVGRINVLDWDAGIPAEEMAAVFESIANRSEFFETRHIGPGGRLFDVEISAGGVELEGERFILASSRDISKRKELERELIAKQERYLAFMRLSRDGIHLLDMQGRLVEANDAFLSMIGRDREDIAGLNVRDWDQTLPDGEVDSALRANAAAADMLMESRYERPDGRSLDVEISIKGVELDGAQFILASARDSSKRKELERQLIAKQEQLEALNRSLEERVEQGVAEIRSKDQLLITQGRQAAMGEMIGNIAHQWRQPLNALSLVLANLRDAARTGELDGPAVEEAVGEGNRLIQRMSSTINDFRDFFTPEKKKIVFSARAAVLQSIALIDASYRQAGIAIVLEDTPDLRLLGFSNEYSQIVLNLLANAKQAIERAEVARGQVTLRLETRDGLGCLVVRDNGGGIPDAILDRIFDPYFSTKEKGSGIGLYMSRQIAEKSLGGSIDARNVGDGAEFTVRTPLAMS